MNLFQNQFSNYPVNGNEHLMLLKLYSYNPPVLKNWLNEIKIDHVFSCKLSTFVGSKYVFT